MKKFKLKSLWIILVVSISLSSNVVEAAHENGKPVIFNSTESIKPEETIGLQGAGFGENPEVWFALVTGTETKLEPQQEISVLTHSEIYIAAKIPENVSVGLYAVWVKNGQKISDPVFINRARIMTSEFDEIMPGTRFRLFGHNLSLEGNAGYVRFVAPDKTSYKAKIENDDPYVAEIQTPNKLKAGIKYEIFICNGAGDKFGECKFDESVAIREKADDPLKLNVPWGADFSFANNVYNVKADSRLFVHAVGDGLSNDREAIQLAIDQAAKEGGGVIYLPKGIYKIEYVSGTGITMKSKVVLKGDGKDQSVVKYGYGKPFTTERVRADYGWTLGWPDARTEGMGLVFPGLINTSGLIGLSFVNVNESGSFVHTVKNMPEGGSKVVVKDCGFDFNTGWGLALVTIDKLLIDGCELNNQSIDVRGINAPTRTWPLDVKNSYNTIIRNNTFNYYAGRFGANGCHHIIYENNTFLRDGDHQAKGETGGINYDYVTDIIILRNSFLVKGEPIKSRNQGETILSQGGDPNQMDMGIVSESTSTTITDRKKEWQDFTDRISTSWQYAVHPTNYFIAIVDGPGTGQWRTITSNNDTLLTIDRPWDVIPETGSNYIIGQWSADQALVKDNILKDNHQGIMMYCGGHDITIVGNKLINSGGIYLRADQRSKLKRYNLLWNAHIVQNEMIDTNGLRPAFVSMLLAKSKDDKPFGTGTIGVEIRENKVQAFTPNATKSGIGEGYYNWMGSAAVNDEFFNPRMPGLLGTIFEGNQAIDAKVGFTIGAGAHHTIVINNHLENVPHFIENQINVKRKTGAEFTFSDY